MPIFQLHIANREFKCCEEVEAVDFEAARKEGLKAALGIGAEEVTKGSPFFAAEVRLERDGESQRFLVSIGQSPLK